MHHNTPRIVLASALLASSFLLGACPNDDPVLEDRGVCDALIECANHLAPGTGDAYEDAYGPDGSCWGLGPSAWQGCRDFCLMSLVALNLTATSSGETCGTCSTDSDCTDFGENAECDAGYCTIVDTNMTGDVGDDVGTGDTGDTGSGLPSHADDIQPLWDANCVTDCHTPGGLAAFLDLSDGYISMVGVSSTQVGESLVTAGDSTSSYLIAKLRGTQVEFGGLGGQMPANGAPLSNADITKVEEWIDAGALP